LSARWRPTRSTPKRSASWAPACMPSPSGPDGHQRPAVPASAERHEPQSVVAPGLTHTVAAPGGPHTRAGRSRTGAGSGDSRTGRWTE
jgi:hypothetical protein